MQHLSGEHGLEREDQHAARSPTEYRFRVGSGLHQAPLGSRHRHRYGLRHLLRHSVESSPRFKKNEERERESEKTRKSKVENQEERSKQRRRERAEKEKKKQKKEKENENEKEQRRGVQFLIGCVSRDSLGSHHFRSGQQLP